MSTRVLVLRGMKEEAKKKHFDGIKLLERRKLKSVESNGASKAQVPNLISCFPRAFPGATGHSLDSYLHSIRYNTRHSTKEKQHTRVESPLGNKVGKD